jgi:hypothetical protein
MSKCCRRIVTPLISSDCQNRYRGSIFFASCRQLLYDLARRHRFREQQRRDAARCSGCVIAVIQRVPTTRPRSRQNCRLFCPFRAPTAGLRLPPVPQGTAA